MDHAAEFVGRRGFVYRYIGINSVVRLQSDSSFERELDGKFRTTENMPIRADAS